MKKYLIYLGLAGIVIIFLVLQVVGNEKPSVSMDNRNDIFKVEIVDSKVATLVKNACYDCHSFETKFPWYSTVAPVSWFIYDHIEHGREELNFSEWGEMEKKRKIRKLKEMAEEIEKKKMPLDDYVKLHPEADLSEEQKQLIIDWTQELALKVFSE